MRPALRAVAAICACIERKCVREPLCLGALTPSCTGMSFVAVLRRCTSRVPRRIHVRDRSQEAVDDARELFMRVLDEFGVARAHSRLPLGKTCPLRASPSKPRPLRSRSRTDPSIALALMAPLRRRRRPVHSVRAHGAAPSKTRPLRSQLLCKISLSRTSCLRQASKTRPLRSRSWRGSSGAQDHAQALELAWDSAEPWLGVCG